MNAQGGVGVEADEDLLPAALDRRDAAIFQETSQINIARLDNVGPEVTDGGDTVADQMGGQCADDGFDFGQLGHCNYYFRGASIKMTNELEWLEYIRCSRDCASRARTCLAPTSH